MIFLTLLGIYITTSNQWFSWMDKVVFQVKAGDLNNKTYFFGALFICEKWFYHTLKLIWSFPWLSQISCKDFFCPQNCENRPEMGQRWVFKFIEKFGINFYWICSKMKTYIICCSCTNPIFGKIVQTKSLSANQIAGFFNQQYLQNKSVK